MEDKAEIFRGEMGEGNFSQERWESEEGFELWNLGRMNEEK